MIIQKLLGNFWIVYNRGHCWTEKRTGTRETTETKQGTLISNQCYNL